MKAQPVPPERVMICAAEHPSGETIFICRGMPGRFQITPATPEEMAWIEENRDQFRDFADLSGQAEDLRKQLGELAATLQETKEALAALVAENAALKAAAVTRVPASEPPAQQEEAPEPKVQAQTETAATVPPAQPPAEAPKPAEGPEPAAKTKPPAKTTPGTKPSLK